MNPEHTAELLFIESLMKLMSAHRITSLKTNGVELVQIPLTPPTPKTTDKDASSYEALTEEAWMKLSIDEQDAIFQSQKNHR